MTTGKGKRKQPRITAGNTIRHRQGTISVANDKNFLSITGINSRSPLGTVLPAEQIKQTGGKLSS